MRIAPLLALPLLVLAVACGSDDTPVASVDSTTTTTAAAPSTTVPATEACSTSGLRVTLNDQDLPPAVAATREAVFDAAVACDYDALAALAGKDFSYTFGGSDELALPDYWRDEEARGDVEPMRMLVQVLNLPSAERHDDDLSYRSWPSADQDHRTKADWDAIRGLYDDETVDQFEAGDFYYGYRTGIREDGAWMYFVAGD